MGNLFGGRGIAKASKSIAQATDRLVDASILEMRETRRFITEKAWPDIQQSLNQLNESLLHLDHVLEKLEDTLTRIDKFVDTATHSLNIHTKTLGMVLMILAALLCRLIIINLKSKVRRTHLSAEEVVLYTFYIICLFIAFFFAYNLLIDLKLIERQGSYRFIIILFSVSLLEVVLKALGIIAEYIVKVFHFLFNWIIVKPLNWLNTPYRRGKMYFSGVCSIAFLSYAIILLLYFGDVTYGYYLFVIATIRNYGVDDSEQRNTWKTKFKVALILYVAFAVIALFTHLSFSALISYCFRPLWRLRNLHFKNK